MLLVSPMFTVAFISLTIELFPDPDVIKIIGLVPANASVAFVCIDTEVELITYTK